MNSDSSAPCSTSVNYNSSVPWSMNSLLTCKCPWYILSTQSVADLSVGGSLDFFHTWEADCRTERWHEPLRRSLWTGGPGEPAERSCPLLRCWIWHFLLVQGFSARRKKRAYVGPHFYLFLRCADAGLWHAPGGLFNGSRGVQSPRINSSFYKQGVSPSLCNFRLRLPFSSPPLSAVH